MATYGYDKYGNSVYGPDSDGDSDTPCPPGHGSSSGNASPPPPGSPPVPLPPAPGGPTSTYPGSSVTVPAVTTAYILPSLGAQALDYTRILLAWDNISPATMTSVVEFRILANPWGFPVDENDGTVIYDVQGSPASPGVQFVDTSATPGTIQYYGVYVYNNEAWLRAGFTACLLPAFHGYGDRLLSDLPPFFQNQDTDLTSQDVSVAAPSLPASGGTVTSPYSYDVDVWLSAPANVMANGIPMGMVTRFPLPAGASATISYSGTIYWQWISRAVQPQNTALTDFLNVLGFGLDTVKTQYDIKLRGVNDPMTMSLGDLVNLCAQIGIPYNAEIPAYAMRKAALNWGHVMQERGTLAGIAQNITMLTGYPSDVQTSRNFLLDNDQSGPVSPVFENWSANSAYAVGEIVTFPVAEMWSVITTYDKGDVVQYNDLLYTCVSPNQGSAPTNATYWAQNVQGPYNFFCLANTTPGVEPSGNVSENWALIYGSAYNGGSKYTTDLNIAGLSGDAGTWEYLESTGVQLSLNVGVGLPAPQTWTAPQSAVTGPNASANAFRIVNGTSGTLTNTWLRSVCRSNADVTAGLIVPDPQVVVEHATPVPISTGPWDSTVTYKTNDLAYYQNVNYIALRQSTNATPPLPGVSLNQNYDFESGVSPWVAGANVGIDQSNSYAYHGHFSMAITATGINAHAQSENIPVIPGGTYQGTALVYSTASVTGVSLAANWNDPFGTYLNGAFPTGITLAANTWTEVSVVFTVPDNATTVWLAPTIGQVGSTTYWDVVALSCIATPEWGPLGFDSRFPITMSGYGIADIGFTPTISEAVTPFVEWYDNWGNLVTRVFARTSSTSGGYPSNYQFDSFNTGAGFPVAGRVPVNPASVWSVPAGTWTVSTNGSAFAGETDFDAIGVLASPASGIVAATVSVPAQSGDDCGPLFWYENTSNFWMAGLDNLYYVSSGITRTPIAYAATCQQWDRLYVQFDNTTNTTTLPGGATVVGPSAIVYRNEMTASNILVVVGSGGTARQTAMSSLTSPYVPSTSATSSFAGIASIAI